MENKYKKLMSNTMLFAISNFSSKLLSIILQPYITFAMGEVDEVGITKLVQQIGSLLIPLVSMGVSFASSVSVWKRPTAKARCLQTAL